jgi:hypothetical protein
MEDWTTGSNATSFSVSTTPTGSISSVKRFWIAPNGNVGIKNVDPQYTLDVSGNANFLSGLFANGINVTGQIAAVSGALQAQIGLAGVLSLNSKVGLVEIAGAGGLTVSTPLLGSIIYVSGDQSISGALAATGVALGAKIDALSGFQQLFTTSVSTGVDTQFISFSPAFPSTPRIVMSLQTNGVNYMIGQTGCSVSGYYATFSDVIMEAGIVLTTYAKV